jgi:hypothetical protein
MVYMNEGDMLSEGNMYVAYVTPYISIIHIHVFTVESAQEYQDICVIPIDVVHSLSLMMMRTSKLRGYMSNGISNRDFLTFRSSEVWLLNDDESNSILAEVI